MKRYYPGASPIQAIIKSHPASRRQSVEEAKEEVVVKEEVQAPVVKDPVETPAPVVEVVSVPVVEEPVAPKKKTIKKTKKTTSEE